MGKYLKEIHACNLPEFDPTHGQGTVWQCDCEKVFIQTWRNGLYNIPSGYAWRVISPNQWDAETLTEKPHIIDLPKQTEEPSRKKRWHREPQTHHCGFDFRIDQRIATCKCGVTSTNPYYVKPDN